MGNQIINPATDAVLGIDIMKTFMEGGGLAVSGGETIIDPMLRLVNMLPYNRRFFVIELHRLGHISLASSYMGLGDYYMLTYEEVSKWTDDNHKISKHARFTLAQLKLYLRVVVHQTLWPNHAIEGTEEAQLHPVFQKIQYNSLLVKGQDPTRDSYSGVRDALGRSTGLADLLRLNNVRRIFDGGLAEEYCKGWTSIHLADEGFEVYSVKEATKAVGAEPEEVEMMKTYFEASGVNTISINDIIV